MITGIAANAAVALALLCVLDAASAADVRGAKAVDEVVTRTNAFRKIEGVDPVQRSMALMDAAQRYARYMAKTGNYGHAADGRTPAQRAAAQGYEYCIVSENIAYHYRSTGYASFAALAEEFVEGWKQSPEHRKNMLASHVTETGVAIAQGADGRYFAVQMFGRPRSAAIRFSVVNRSGEAVKYRAGERHYSLPVRATRTHMVCRPTEIALVSAGKDAQPIEVESGARYTVRDGALSAE